MSASPEVHSSDGLAARLDALCAQVRATDPGAHGGPAEVREALETAHGDATGLDHPAVADALRRLLLVTEVWECLAAEGPDRAVEVATFCEEALDRLAAGIRESQEQSQADWVGQESAARWQDYLDLLEPTGASSTEGFADHPHDDASSIDESPAMDVGSLLRLLSGGNGPVPPARREPPPPAAHPTSGGPLAIDAEELLRRLTGGAARPAVGGGPRPAPSPQAPAVENPNGAPRQVPAADAAVLADLDAELRDVFLADAIELFAGIEESATRLDRSDIDSDALRQAARHFHTLKGAAGAVGLMDLAALARDLDDMTDVYEGSGAVPRSMIDRLHEGLAQIEAYMVVLRRAAGLAASPERGELPGTAETEIETAWESGGPSEIVTEVPAASRARHVPEVDESFAAGLDAELRDVFLADATDLFERIEVAVLSLDQPEGAVDGLLETGRHLHTLKGAAGAVGLSELSSLLHHLEDRIAEAGNGPVPPALVDALHDGLGQIEGHLVALRRGAKTATGAEAVPPSWNSAEEVPVAMQAATVSPVDLDGSVRVPNERIEDLMDLVSELIARRGPWAAHAEKTKEFASTARACRNQLMTTLDQFRDGALAPADGPGRAPTAAGARRSELGGLTRRLAEHVEDLGVLADTAWAAAIPAADDADILSQLTLRLWDALQSIRVVPVRGLFLRLARVARDAAKAEGRQIEIEMVGAETTLDRAVQEKVFEPLLHVVRNSVGHGIEDAETRQDRNKPRVGRIRLEARRDGNTMIIAVRDDGRGLDYDAIIAKGKRLGLIGPNESPSREQLNALVFQAGFTTRQEANTVAGRGVGLDVVAREIARLRGGITLVSQQGKGTTLTIRLSSRLWLEQAMVVRVDNQPLALPLEAVEDATALDREALEGTGPDATYRFRDRKVPLRFAREVLGLPPLEDDAAPKVLLLRVEGQTHALLIDAIDGPKELVIKPLGALLLDHPFISGTSLSASGELIYIVDPAGLMRRQIAPAEPVEAAAAAPKRSRVLVVDDSISVRRVAARNLRALGLDVDEAADGVEAICKLRARPYRLVLTDLEMPRMDGFELLEELGRTGTSASTPVIVSSTRSDPATRRRVLNLGARAFVPKPAAAEELAGAIGSLLGSDGLDLLS